MTRGEQIIAKVRETFDEIRNKYPHIGDEDLLKNGEIYYMNGNDGTDFDWNANGNCSEFYIYFKNEIGFIKLLVNVGDYIKAYIYPNGEMRAVDTLERNLSDGDSLYLASLLYRMADKKGIYDAPVTEIDFSYEPTKEELKIMNEAYEEPEDFFDWED